MSSKPAPAPLEEPIPQWKKKLPMWLTWSRMAICPLFVFLLLLDDPIWGWVAALLFIAASITDYFDGMLARRYRAISTLGKFMDPIADKILIASVLIMLIPSGRVGPILVLLLLTRDILIGGIRSVAAADQVIIDAKAAGKWKTGLQMVSIPAILIRYNWGGLPVYQIGLGLLWASVILSLFSGYQYVQLYLESREKKNLA
jgi:CDP-diacylglycerol--glycerol-3-phosphate 3-phosphatidyltransferase